MNRIGVNIGLRGDGGGIPLGIKSEFFMCLGGSCLELGLVCMVRASNHLRGMGHPSRDHFKALLWLKLNNNSYFFCFAYAPQGRPPFIGFSQ